MDKIVYYFLLAILTTYCVLTTNDKIVKPLFIISTACWWMLVIGEIIEKIVYI